MSDGAAYNTGYFYFWHGKNSNLSWIDGHVAAIKRSDVSLPYPTITRYPASGDEEGKGRPDYNYLGEPAKSGL